jgi:hypothetical protein
MTRKCYRRQWREIVATTDLQEHRPLAPHCPARRTLVSEDHTAAGASGRTHAGSPPHRLAAARSLPLAARTVPIRAELGTPSEASERRPRLLRLRSLYVAAKALRAALQLSTHEHR